MPGIAWANAVPDAGATVDFEIGDKKLQFSGTGYHDKVPHTLESLPNLSSN